MKTNCCEQVLYNNSPVNKRPPLVCFLVRAREDGVDERVDMDFALVSAGCKYRTIFALVLSLFSAASAMPETRRRRKGKAKNARCSNVCCRLPQLLLVAQLLQSGVPMLHQGSWRAFRAMPAEWVHGDVRLGMQVHTLNGGHAEYGVGAQNSSEAIAAMQQPLPKRADGTPPPGRSERLGNIIDSWYFASLGNGARISALIAMSCNAELSFGRFLATRLGAVSVSEAQATAAKAEAAKHESWGFYTYPTIRALMPQLRHDLRAAMRMYAQTYDPTLAAQRYDGGGSHLVVHYRMGDFVTNRWCVPPGDIARVAASLRPSVIEIMDGGVKHLDQIDGWSQGPHRANRSRIAYANKANVELQGRLKAALTSAAPWAKIVHHTPVSIDADWFRIAHAPLLVTGAGSFAVTAAIAGFGSSIRTPAADNLNFPDRHPVGAEETMAPTGALMPTTALRCRVEILLHCSATTA